MVIIKNICAGTREGVRQGEGSGAVGEGESQRALQTMPAESAQERARQGKAGVVSVG